MDFKKLASLLGEEGKSNDPNMLKQMESMWSMLDDLANNDQKAYDEFIKNNLKQGAEDLKKTHEKKMEAYTHKLKASDYALSLIVPVVLKHPQEKTLGPGLITQGIKEIPTMGTMALNLFGIDALPSFAKEKEFMPVLDHFEYKLEQNAIKLSASLALSIPDAKSILERKDNWREALARCLSKTQGVIGHEMIRIRMDVIKLRKLTDVTEADERFEAK